MIQHVRRNKKKKKKKLRKCVLIDLLADFTFIFYEEGKVKYIQKPLYGSQGKPGPGQNRMMTS